jgi:predicted AAA+ superfamily ATPase
MKKRSLEKIIREASESFPVLMITGPRQVGKTTLLQACAEEARGYVTLDNLEQRALAQQDPALFLQTHQTPLIIDEIQYAPQLFSTIKIAADRTQQPGLFWLTGSQKFHLMKGVTESLAGRVAILDLLGLSQAELANRADKTLPFMPTNDWLEAARKSHPHKEGVLEIYARIWRGSFPKLALDKKVSRDLFYNSYLQTYLERDVRDLLNVGDLTKFKLFLRAAAARTGQLLNYSDFARDADIDHKTAKSWISVLEASGIIYLLQPYHSNITSRLTKTPKLYFLDTGLCAYLTQWSSPESLEAGAMSGPIFETYAFSEILKSYWNHGKALHCYYYRDLDQKEIDFILEEGDSLYPVECKKSATPSRDAAKHFRVLEKFQKKIGHGAVICLCEEIVPLSREVDAIPVSYL